MNCELKHQRLLTIILIACIVSTGIHFTDNYLYFENYPQPDWITPSSVYTSWIIWTIIGIAGYGLYTARRFWLAYLCLVIYSLSGLASLGHYFYGTLSEFSLKMHFFIVTDGLTGLGLVAFTIWSSLIIGEPTQKSKIKS